jgi:hypothetical protein
MPPLLTLPATASGQRFALSVAETQDWLASLPLQNAAESGRGIAEQLASLNRSRTPLRERLVLTALLRDHAEQLLPDLNAQIDSAHVPLGAKPRAVARLIDDLLSEFAYAYKLAVSELPERWIRFGVARKLHLPVTRALQMLSRRLVLAHRTYAPAPPTVWSEMHQLFALARRHRVEKLSLSIQNESPLAIYREALALSFAGPHKLMQGELNLALNFLSDNSDLAVFIDSVPQDPVDGLFLVQAGRDVPGNRWNKRHAGNGMQPAPDELVLNTSRLADRALQMTDPTSNTPQTGGNPRQTLDFLHRLVRHWTASGGRQFSRLRRHARVDICVGLHGVWRFLSQTGSDDAVQTSEWMINNESPGGFALMHVSGPVEPVKVGEVLGVRSRDSDRVHICVVRWVLSDSPEHVELGLEELAPNAKPISIARLATSGGYGPGTEPGLLLPEIPALKKAAAILTMPGSFDAAGEFHLGEPHKRVRATQLVEQTRSLDLFQFSPVN